MTGTNMSESRTVRYDPGVPGGTPMAEKQWLKCSNPARMLYVLDRMMRGDFCRKLRLLAVACCQCHKNASFVSDPLSKYFLQLAVKYADGLITAAELQNLSDQIRIDWPFASGWSAHNFWLGAA